MSTASAFRLLGVSFSSVGGQNSCTLCAAVAPSGGVYGAETALVSGEALLLGTFSPDASYSVRFTAADDLGGSAVYYATIPTRKWAMKFRPDGSGVAFAVRNPETGLETVGETTEGRFPFVVLASPEAASKAENTGETVVFYEDPNAFFDGIFVVFGDGEVKFLEGDFADHSEAMEAAANTFGLSDKAAADLLKKAAAIDKILED